MAHSSKRQASPPSKSRTRAPRSRAAYLSEPSRNLAWKMTGAPKARQVQGGVRVVDVAPDLGEVGAAVRAGVHVDADLALGDDLGHQQVGDPARERPPSRPGEGPVEVAPVGQVAVAVHEAQDVDDRDRQQRAADRLRRDLGEHPADDLDADDLVAVDGGIDPDRRPVVTAVDDVDGQG